MNRVAIVLDENGELDRVVSDEPIRCFVVDEKAPDDRVYELSTALSVGVHEVRQCLGSEPIGHAMDDTFLGEGCGPRKSPPKPSLKPVS